MKEIPILFSTMMVQALLAGRKTQTRRIVKPQPSSGISWTPIVLNGHAGWIDGHGAPIKCPFGKPGDVLWVRESFQKVMDVDTQDEQIRYAADSPEPIYEVDGDGFQMFNKDGSEKMVGWKPSIHMPKTAARIWLRVKNVRVERAQNISEGDAVAEGVQRNCEGKIEDCIACRDKGVCQSEGEYWHYGRDFEDFPAFSAIESFESLWKKINGLESWDSNPWVWVVEFEVLITTGKP